MVRMSWVVVGSVLFVAGCVASRPSDPPVIEAKPVTLADGTVAKPTTDISPDMRSIELARVQIDIPRGTSIGGIHPIPLTSCFGKRVGDITYDGARYTEKTREWGDAFYKVMSGYGYRLTGAPQDLFAEQDHRRAEFLFGANVTAIHIGGTLLCDFLTGRSTGISGNSSITVEWQVFDPLHRKVVHRETTQGEYTSDRVLPIDPYLMVQLAFVDAINKLAANPAVRAIATAKDAGGDGSGRADGGARTVRHIVLPRLPLSEKALGTTIDEARAATVLIELGNSSHGSGFIVSANGLVISNAHVTGDQHFVRVRLISGRAVIGEVLQTDNIRDVALIKLEGGGYPALPIRETPVNVAEEVYAIGAPQSKALAWTVTRGIVSAYRQASSEDHLDYIQADVAIHGGNSGGPLLDRNGNVVGICEGGFAMDQEKKNASLNVFIPILDGVSRLGLTITDPTGGAQARRSAANN